MTDLSGWPALVLAAGLGTRLAPLSLARAKAALPVAGTPVIGRILGWLRRAGVRRVVINLHHRPESITRLVGDGSAWDVTVRYSWEPIVLGSAGGPRRALPLLESDRFLIVNGDTLTTCDLRAVVRKHLDTGARVTMAVVPGDVNRYGGVVVGADDVVVGFARARHKALTAPAHGTAPAHRTAPATPSTPVHRTAPVAPSAPVAPNAPVLHFLGVQAVDAAAFADLSEHEPSETVRTLYPRLIAEHAGAIMAHRSEAEFLDIGTPRDYLNTVAAVAAREGQPFDRGDGCVVHPGARLSATVLWDRVTVGPNVSLTNCVVADEVTVPEGGDYDSCALVNDTDGRLVVSAF
jgi:mannose-1-phosphate guanylyltransferase